jgi:hypothetical protein
MYVPHDGVPVILPGIVFPFHCILQLAGLQWTHCNLPSHGKHRVSHLLTKLLLQLGELYSISF